MNVGKLFLCDPVFVHIQKNGAVVEISTKEERIQIPLPYLQSVIEYLEELNGNDKQR